MCCVERLPGTSSKIECSSHDTLCYCTWNLVKFSSTVVSVPRYVVCFPVPLCILCEHRTAVKNNDSLCLYMISYTLYMYTSCCLLFIQIHAIVNIIFDLQQVERTSLLRQNILKKLLTRLPINFQHFLLA